VVNFSVIHAAPRREWPALVKGMIDNDWTADDTRRAFTSGAALGGRFRQILQGVAETLRLVGVSRVAHRFPDFLRSPGQEGRPDLGMVGEIPPQRPASPRRAACRPRGAIAGKAFARFLARFLTQATSRRVSSMVQSFSITPLGNRAAADGVAAGNIRQCLAELVTSANCFALLVRSEFLFAAEMDATGLRPLSPFAGPGPDQFALEFG
jgi:hypothetical protein